MFRNMNTTLRGMIYKLFLITLFSLLLLGCGSASSSQKTQGVNNAPTIDTNFFNIFRSKNSGARNYKINIDDLDGDALTLEVESNDTSLIAVTKNWNGFINQATYQTPLDFNLTVQTNATGIAKITIIVSDDYTNTTTSFDVNVTSMTLPTTLKKTGQIKSYDENGIEVIDNSYKDDGYYQKGVTPSYTRDATKEIVTDNVTSLEWQDDVSSITSTYNLADATTQCQNLSLGGYTDWRLPTHSELMSIADYGRYNPAIDPIFHNTISQYYWSSSSYTGYPNGIWIVGFYLGFQYNSTQTNKLYVRCVRIKK